MAASGDENNAPDLEIALGQLSLEGKQDIFETMENTMLHDPHCRGRERYSSINYGMFQIEDGETSGFFVNDGDSHMEGEKDKKTHTEEKDKKTHTEEKIGKTLRSWTTQGKLKGPQTVTVYLNLSPCPLCVDKLLDHLEWSQHKESPLRLVIKCVALYNINWPECQKKRCSHRKIADPEHNYHKNGILKLMRGGVAVEAFSPDDWAVVRKALGLPIQEPSWDRNTTDEMVRKSLEALKEETEQQQ